MKNDPFFVNECGFFIQRFYEVCEKVTPNWPYIVKKPLENTF